MSDRFLEGFNLIDAISQPTEMKGTQIEPEAQELNNFDFYEDKIEESERIQENEPIHERIPEHSPEPKELKPNYDAEANASGLVHMLTAMDSMVLGALGTIKVRTDFGGAKVLKKMKQALVKEIAGGTITEQEKALILKFKEFKANMQLLSGEVFPNDAEIENQIKLAIPYMKKVQWEISEGATFWASYGGNLVKRGSKIFGV